MDKTLRFSLLYDYYGELLTPKQREAFSQHHLEDLSLAEIAECSDCSPQSVHDLIRRTEKLLEDYEKCLGLVARAEQARVLYERIKPCLPDREQAEDLEKMLQLF